MINISLEATHVEETHIEISIIRWKEEGYDENICSTRTRSHQALSRY